MGILEFFIFQNFNRIDSFDGMAFWSASATWNQLFWQSVNVRNSRWLIESKSDSEEWINHTKWSWPYLPFSRIVDDSTRIPSADSTRSDINGTDIKDQIHQVLVPPGKYSIQKLFCIFIVRNYFGWLFHFSLQKRSSAVSFFIHEQVVIHEARSEENDKNKATRKWIIFYLKHKIYGK